LAQWRKRELVTLNAGLGLEAKAPLLVAYSSGFGCGTGSGAFILIHNAAVSRANRYAR
jgi:lipoprotein